MKRLTPAQDSAIAFLSVHGTFRNQWNSDRKTNHSTKDRLRAIGYIVIVQEGPKWRYVLTETGEAYVTFLREVAPELFA